MKNILFVVLGIVLSCSNVFADQVKSVDKTDINFVETHTSELLSTVKSHRASVYSSLNLNDNQAKLINDIDKRRYIEVEPELIQLSQLVKKLDDIANSENCTIKKVNSVKKEFKPVQNELYKITKKYEKELISVLTSEQKSKYKSAKKQMRENMRRDNQLKS